MNNLKLTLDEIEQKQFGIDFKGYSCYEVDSFLDLIMEDYQSMQEVIQTLHEKVSHLQGVIDQLANENQKLSMELSSQPTNLAPSTPAMIDIVRRLSRLEEVVFHQQ